MKRGGPSHQDGRLTSILRRRTVQGQVGVMRPAACLCAVSPSVVGIVAQKVCTGCRMRRLREIG